MKPYTLARLVSACLGCSLAFFSTVSIAQAQDTTRNPSPALRLRRELEPLVAAAGQETAASRALAARTPDAARALYRELLFEAVDARLYGNTPLSPHAEAVRQLLAQLDPAHTAWETKLAAWLGAERKLGAGFLPDSTGFEQMLYSYIASERKNVENQKVPEGAKPVSQREMSARALGAAEASGSELAVASSAANLAVALTQERRPTEARPLIERAGAIWIDWRHETGIFGAAFYTAETYYLTEQWKEAANFYEQAAQQALKVPALRGAPRATALSSLAGARRNAGDREGVRAALEIAVNLQQELLNEATGRDQRIPVAKSLADLQTQLGGAYAALNRYAEVGEWYARADRTRADNYPFERAQLEEQIVKMEELKKERLNDPNIKEADKKIYAGSFESFIDTYLSMLDSLAKGRNDRPLIAQLGERRLALARAGGNPENISKVLGEVAAARLAAGDHAAARITAIEALQLRNAAPRRAQIYDTVHLLGEIAEAAGDLAEAERRYREVISVTTADALPPPIDLDAEPDAGIRRIKVRSNHSERMMRVAKSLYARMALVGLYQYQSNYRAAAAELRVVGNDISRLYAAGAPDEAELRRWLKERETEPQSEEGTNRPLAFRVKLADVSAFRQSQNLAADDDELQRIQMAELLANGMREIITLKRAQLLDAQNDVEGAADAYREAITLFDNFIGGGFPPVGAYLALARIERERGDYAAAEAPLQTALAHYQRKQDASGVAGVLAQQSALRREQGRLDEARKFAEDALKIVSTLNSPQERAGMLRTLARVETEQGDAAALKSSEQRLRESLAIWRSLGLRAHVAYTLSYLGLTLEKLGRETDALAAYEEAVKLIEAVTSSLSDDVSPDVFNSSKSNRDLYDHLIKLLIKRGRAADALQYLERAKSKSLVDALSGANVGAPDPRLKALLEQVRHAQASVRAAEITLTNELAKPAAQRDESRLAAARSQLNGAQQSYAQAVEQIKHQHPSYASLVAVNPTNLARVRERLPEKTVLLSFFPTDKELYIFVVTRDAEPSIRIAPVGRNALAELVAQYRTAVDAKINLPTRGLGVAGGIITRGKKYTRQEASPLNDTTAKLYDALLAPVQAEIERADTLLIVPAGELYYLPIHALGRKQSDGSLSFLIEQKRVAYLASADLLNVVANHQAAASLVAPANGTGTTQSSTLFAIGNPDGSLPGAAQEVSTIKSVFARANVFIGPDATVQRVAAGSIRASYVHFATHGVIDSRDPKESYLILAGTPDRLTIKDIVEDRHQLSFAGTRLVTLSACNTNIGGWDPSAAYSSLSRAFAKAGAPTVIASLWQVDDESTRDLMAHFYQELTAGQPTAEALRRAQLAVMRDPRFAHPFYWAAFVVLGQWQ